MRLAQKLELALVMANPARESESANQVGIIRSASDVANTIEGASHLSEDGRRLLFSKSYPLAWKYQDKTEVIPDSLIVGVSQVHADLSKMDIEIMLLSKSDLKIQPLAVQSQTVLPEKTADSRGQLGKSLFDQLILQDTTRGLIVDGKKSDAAINTVTFKRQSTPVMATSIRYCKAR